MLWTYGSSLLFMKLRQSPGKYQVIKYIRIILYHAYLLCFPLLSRMEVCTLLLCHGADPTMPNCHSKTPIDLAPTEDIKQKIECEPEFLSLSLSLSLSLYQTIHLFSYW